MPHGEWQLLYVISNLVLPPPRLASIKSWNHCNNHIYDNESSQGKHQSRYELTSPLLVTPVDCFPTHDTFLLVCAQNASSLNIQSCCTSPEKYYSLMKNYLLNCCCILSLLWRVLPCTFPSPCKASVSQLGIGDNDGITSSLLPAGNCCMVRDIQSLTGE